MQPLVGVVLCNNNSGSIIPSARFENDVQTLGANWERSMYTVLYITVRILQHTKEKEKENPDHFYARTNQRVIRAMDLYGIPVDRASVSR